jgi:hypothetical protein
VLDRTVIGLPAYSTGSLGVPRGAVRVAPKPGAADARAGCKRAAILRCTGVGTTDPVLVG